jgi:CheY-like chemotaxis protein
MAALRVLLVEDEAISARAAQVMLERIGCVVTAIVDTGEGAIDKAGEQRPDLILMDIRLKGEMNGLEAMAEIRTRHGIPGIFVSAYSPEEMDDQRELFAGSRFLAKPIDERDLATAVDELRKSGVLAEGAGDGRAPDP